MFKIWDGIIDMDGWMDAAKRRPTLWKKMEAV